MEALRFVILLGLAAFIAVQAAPVEKRQWFNNPNVGTIQMSKAESQEESA